MSKGLDIFCANRLRRQPARSPRLIQLCVEECNQAIPSTVERGLGCALRIFLAVYLLPIVLMVTVMTAAFCLAGWLQRQLMTRAVRQDVATDPLPHHDLEPPLQFRSPSPLMHGSHHLN